MTSIRFQPSSHLSISRYSLIESLSNVLPRHEVEDWLSFCEAMSFVVNCSYGGVLEGMRRLAWEESREQSTELQHHYLEKLLSLVSAAQYSPITEQYYKFGVCSQNFSSGHRIDVDLSRLEPIFSSYFENNIFWFGTGVESELGARPPEYSSRVLVYYRGTSIIKSTGYHIQAKLKYLVEFWITAIGALGRLLHIPLFAKDAKFEDTMQMGDDGSGGSRFGAKKLDRVTVESHMKKNGVLKSLFRKICLSEPAYDNVIIVYPAPSETPSSPVKLSGDNIMRNNRHHEERSTASTTEHHRVIGRSAVCVAMVGAKKMKPPSRKKPFQASGAKKKPAKLEPEQPQANTHETQMSATIKIESYSNVPFKDLGVIMPGRKVRLGLQHKMRFTTELILSIILVCICFANLESSGAVSINAMILIFFVLSLTQTVNVLSSLTEMQRDLKSILDDWADQRLVGKDTTFVASLANQVQEQEMKEVLLGYFFLWKKSPLTQRQLDYEVETFLNDQFRLELDFEVDDAVQKLILLKLIEEAGGKFRCVQRPKDYLDDPTPKWIDFYASFKQTAPAGPSPHTATMRQPPPALLQRHRNSIPATESLSMSHGTITNNSLTVPYTRRNKNTTTLKTP
eukprot:TRINITY_DN2538_c1_g2_i1.p1 TRINITY_DN2538_c1_g2~~TRINITY_DN2538_c1_g2_i1.p1  ORF type:complete len:640 (+),score=45.11 TRINITY_DN2538_c1_g2_i1:49-1920(+)